MSEIFKKIGSTSTLSQKIEKNIENAIRNKQLLAGQKLPTEKELGEMFGVSRTALREALRRLHARGLINIRKGSGMYVSELSSTDALSSLNLYFELNFNQNLVLNIIKVRQSFEPKIAMMAAENRSEDDLNAIERTIDELKKISPDKKQEQGEIDNRFHVNIAKACQNPVVLLIMEPIYTLMPKIRNLVYAKMDIVKDTTLIYHNSIFEAIRDKDPQAAFERMQEHLVVTEENFNLSLKKQEGQVPL